MRTAEELYEHIDSFNDIKDGEPNSDDVVTYYTEHDNDEYTGFVENTKWCEGGIEKLICKKWILQSDLEQLMRK